MTKTELETLAQELTNENADLKAKLEIALAEIEELKSITDPVKRIGSFSVAV